MGCNCSNSSVGNCGCSEPIELECLGSPGATGANGTNGTNGTDGIVILKNDFTIVYNDLIVYPAWVNLTSIAYTILGSATGPFQQNGDKLIMRYLFKTEPSISGRAKILFEATPIFITPQMDDKSALFIIELQVSRFSATLLKIIVKCWINNLTNFASYMTYLDYIDFTHTLTNPILVTASIMANGTNGMSHQNTCIEFYNKI